jgi:hypothetical protein
VVAVVVAAGILSPIASLATAVTAGVTSFLTVRRTGTFEVGFE